MESSTSPGTSNLFKPLKIGRITVSHRIALAPLTRYRADGNHVPLPFVKEYYAQRASTPGTLLITEGAFISPRASGFRSVPGLWSKEQIVAWKEVTDAVHAKGSFIYCQLWALGRAALEDILRKEFGLKPVSSSATPMPQVTKLPGKQDTSGTLPVELSEKEIQEFIADYGQAAKNCVEAGFDGVEIHGANGYLPDQFTQDNVNKRTDGWGGSVEKRSRFGLAVAKAAVDAIGSDRVGYRISPFSRFQGMLMKDPIPQFSCLVEGLKKLDLAYLHAVESRISGNADVENFRKLDFLTKTWGDKPLLVAGGYRPDTALRAADEDYKDLNAVIVFGRLYISNPDLPFRIRHGIELEPYDRKKFYNARSPDGYVNYPFSTQFEPSKL
ncbi:NADH:flavin oxidoreductase/NADH oxidase family protein [Pseudovirgaria hyperparasitica]|uniref:NADH:flavin oxidoreductase/NADH oxidase family protein n=1 Tax=Pseudovirgaria hyperparasitica TaxID=470096 RepID=A0A6A6WK32_9PEZI|nr:NADH:flavin oxidoreductase/NADH oxidase family protein [Pseudovirgaria hyperparasitica]KAF2762201.1 NADH:flavin oxidoreductase/NADH oxidase family protein [Pseudovirgaria hyperparasitica]